eukprot:761812-Hanusia_phi.AAC.2
MYRSEHRGFCFALWQFPPLSLCRFLLYLPAAHVQELEQREEEVRGEGGSLGACPCSSPLAPPPRASDPTWAESSRPQVTPGHYGIALFDKPSQIEVSVEIAASTKTVAWLRLVYRTPGTRGPAYGLLRHLARHDGPPRRRGNH